MRSVITILALALALVGASRAAAAPDRNDDRPRFDGLEDLGGMLKPQVDRNDLKLRPPAPQRTDGVAADGPLLHITEDMSNVAADLTQLQTDKPVQKKQAGIVSRLDELIKMMEDEQQKQSGKSGKRSGANPTKPMNDSQIVGGPGGQGELHAPKNSRKDWGELPPKQREQILQSKTEGFPPGFEAVLQSYYRRLAQEEVVGDSSTGGTPAAAPTTQPAAP